MVKTSVSVLPFLALLVPLALPIFLLLSRRYPNIREGFTLVAAAGKFLLVASMIPAVLAGTQFNYEIFEVISGVSIALRVDAAGLLFAIVASSLWILTSIYSIGYMRAEKEHSQTRYYCFFALALFATLGVAFAANLLTLYLFYELLSLSTYPLVTHHQDLEARSAGRTYMAHLFGASIALVLPAMLYCYSLTGTLDFTSQGFMSGAASSGVLLVLLCMFVFGFAKAALMPLHSWLPAAMVAPTPVSSLLHAVAVVKVGVFCQLRIFTEVFGIDLLGSLTWNGANAGIIVAVIASITMIASDLIALSQDNLKRVLAFSTVGQLAYIVLGFALVTPKTISASTMHIGFHAFSKITLFFCAGAIFVATGKRLISELNGLGRKMPLTFAAFLIGVLGVIGLPPTAGFLSKWYLLLGTLEAKQYAFFTVVLVSSLLKAAYLFPIVFVAFFKEPAQGSELYTPKLPRMCALPLTLTALALIVAFFYPYPLFDLAELATRNFVGG